MKTDVKKYMGQRPMSAKNSEFSAASSRGFNRDNMTNYKVFEERNLKKQEPLIFLLDFYKRAQK
jgi:hypothetical protein